MWKRRLFELAIAGGLAAGTGCGPGIFACNANPDPCCSEPQSQACADYKERDLSVPVPHDMSSPDLAHD